MTQVACLIGTLLLSLHQSCESFQKNSIVRQRYGSNSPQLRASDATDIILVEWDGCLTDCVPWRTRIGINAAMTVWPEMLPNERSGDDLSWLENKLSSIAHCFTTSNEYSTTCDYALATRLLLEEQELDQGESVGKSGKYANLYHPRSNSGTHKSSSARPPSARRSGSRPLTVGEIAVNWSEGGMIRDTIQMRYHCNYDDPVPMLQQTIDSIVAAKQVPIPTMDVTTRDAILACCTTKSTGQKRHVFITVSLASEVPALVAILETAGIPFVHSMSVVDGLRERNEGHVTVVVSSATTTREILHESPEGSAVYVLDSSWARLQRHVELFGDYIPRQPNGMAKCIEPTKSLCLWLTGIGASIHPTQQAAATMNPWTRFVTTAEMVEVLSARVVS